MRRGSRRGRTTARSVVLGAATALLLGGCGSGDGGDAGTAAEDAGLRRTAFVADVTGVTRVDPRTVEVAYDVPDGCAVRERVRVRVDRDVVRLDVPYSVLENTDLDRCPTTVAATGTVSLPARARDLPVAVDTRQWGRPGQLGALEPCTGAFGCDPPPADHCDAAWVDALLATSELPPERSTEVRACTQRWLVLDVAATVTGCQPVDGASPAPGCDDAATRVRWFAEFAGDLGWQVVASDTAAGCDPVGGVEGFPGQLCSSLPAVRADDDEAVDRPAAGRRPRDVGRGQPQ